MKKLYYHLTVFIFSLLTVAGYSQDYDSQMRQLASDVTKQVKEKNKLNIAVWYFKNSFRDNTTLGDYIGQEFSMYFTDVSNGFEVFDRDAMEQVVKEQNLAKSGMLDPRKIKQIKMYTHADAIITGTVDVASRHSLKIRLKLIDIETGRTLAAIPRNVLKDESIKYILHETGINKTKNIDEGRKRPNRNERYGSPDYVDLDCEKRNVGDFCFENDTTKNYEVVLYVKNNSNDVLTSSYKTLSLNSGESACFYDLHTRRNYQYKLKQTYGNKFATSSAGNLSGSLKVEKCKSIVYNLSSLSNNNRSNNRTRRRYPTSKSKQYSKKSTIKSIIDIVQPIIKKHQ